jgi:hypothetical protein
MNDYDWIDTYQQKMGKEAFRQYRNSVYEMLMGMRPGEYFTIDDHVKTENIDLFIKMVCLFIVEGNHQYDFTNDYKKVRCHEREKNDREKKMDGERRQFPGGKPFKVINRGDSGATGENAEGRPVVSA